MAGMTLLIHRLTCLDETGGRWRERVGSDDISLGGVTINDSREVKKVSPFRVGSFDDGDVKRFNPPREFVSFDESAGGTFPEAYAVTLVLIERDSGGGADGFLDKLVEETTGGKADEIITAVENSGGDDSGFWDEVKVQLAKLAFKLAKEAIESILEDDIFEPVALSATVPSSAAIGVKKSALFLGNSGKYSIEYQWRRS